MEFVKALKVSELQVFEMFAYGWYWVLLFFV